MAQQSPDYKKLFFEEQRKREKAERAQKEERRRREEAEHAEEEQRKKNRETTLPEFLDACHVHLYSGLAVQTNATLSTQGDPSNANSKVRPERIQAWEDFPLRQEAIWNELMGSDFMLERHFTPLLALEVSGRAVRKRMMGSELDLHSFERNTVEDHISSVIEELYRSPALRRKFHLKGSVRFENHANTISSKQQMEEDMQQMSLSENPPRRSARLLAQAKRTKPPALTEPTEPVAVTAARAARSTHPRADQFCVYNTSDGAQDTEHRVAAFVAEYKAPHKLPLGIIYEGLGDMELEEVVHCRETDGLQDHFRRLVAAAITQAFSYMVRAGLEYGYVCTGEAFIFLRVPDDPRTVYYFLSVPKGDVGETTGWAPDSDGDNRLHLTAVGQVLAFTLQALKTPPRNQEWRTDKAAQLKTWELVYDDPLDPNDSIPILNVPSSEYQPPRQTDFLRMSPVQLRRRPASTNSPGCHPRQDQSRPGDDEFDPGDPDTPSRPSQHRSCQPLSQAPDPAGGASPGHDSHSEGKGRQYCTQKCLRGLVEGSLLDEMCPNVRDHGEGRHQIDRPNFLELMRHQLSQDLDTDCKPVGLRGSRGVLFKVRLTSHGYTVAAKCTPIDFIAHLRHEAAIYERLRPIQGIHVPVHLGNVDLVRPYFYEGIAEIVHMMFLSFGGTLISQHINANNRSDLIEQVGRSIQAIHRLGVLHRDAMPRNMLWNEEVRQVMVIDFERAAVPKLGAVLGVISPNRKRKRVIEGGLNKQPIDGRGEFVREMQWAMIELSWLK